MGRGTEHFDCSPFRRHDSADLQEASELLLVRRSSNGPFPPCVHGDGQLYAPEPAEAEDEEWQARLTNAEVLASSHEASPLLHYRRADGELLTKANSGRHCKASGETSV